MTEDERKLRIKFAERALTGFLANPKWKGNTAETGHAAWRYADIMLATMPPELREVDTPATTKGERELALAHAAIHYGAMWRERCVKSDSESRQIVNAALDALLLRAKALL